MPHDGLIHGSVHAEGGADSREDGDQRLDDRSPNRLLVAHNQSVLTVRQYLGSRVPARWAPLGPRRLR